MFTTQRLNWWRLMLFACFIPGVVYLAMTDPGLLWVSVLAYGVIQGIGFNAYLHRYVSHRSFKTYGPIEWALGLLSVPCTVGTPHSWAWIHRVHHRYTETPKDPHCHRHMGYWKSLWCLHYVETEDRRVAMRDILDTPSFMWIHRYYFHLHLAIVAALWLVWGLRL